MVRSLVRIIGTGAAALAAVNVVWALLFHTTSPAGFVGLLYGVVAYRAGHAAPQWAARVGGVAWLVLSAVDGVSRWALAPMLGPSDRPMLAPVGDSLLVAALALVALAMVSGGFVGSIGGNVARGAGSRSAPAPDAP
jgi:hypothetical protein